MGLLDAFRRTPATSEELKARAAKLQRQLDKMMSGNDLVQAATAAALGEDGGAERFAKIQTKASELKAEIEKLTLASTGVRERERIVREQERQRQIMATREYAAKTLEKFKASIRRHDDAVARVIAELTGVRQDVRAAYREFGGRFDAVEWEDRPAVPDIVLTLSRVMQALAYGRIHPLAEEYADAFAAIEDQLSGAPKLRPIEDDAPPPKTASEKWTEWAEAVGLAPSDHSMQKVIAETRETLGGGKQSVVRANQNLQILEKYFAHPGERHYARAKQQYEAGLKTEFGQDLHQRCPGAAICPSFLSAMYDRALPGIKLESANLPRDPTPAERENVFPHNPEAQKDFEASNARRIAATPTIAQAVAEQRRAKINLGLMLGLPAVPPKPAEPPPEDDCDGEEARNVINDAATDLGLGPSETPAQPSPPPEAEQTSQPEQPATDDGHVKW